jgi:hypothetical protein
MDGLLVVVVVELVSATRQELVPVVLVVVVLAVPLMDLLLLVEMQQVMDLVEVELQDLPTHLEEEMGQAESLWFVIQYNSNPVHKLSIFPSGVSWRVL